ncbi:right-handed parallel beta-helix repeat-containing protein [Fibrella arboris]|uniref:right-handed parallel beta-helix repeat-containing protein n=1 Tax=Fibrella arboris TaxID=3242486 RepID=UPI0035222E42
MFIISALEKAKGSFRPALFLFNWFLLSSLSYQSAVVAQTTYYVANAGNDSNNGTTTSTPFQSLAKVNSLALQAGDQVLFRRGDTFRGTLTIRRSGAVNKPIIFDAYGTGSKPILSGSVPVTNWTSAGNNIWQASCASCGGAVTGVYRNGTALPLGRFPNADAPNKGNLTIRAHTEKYQIFSQEHLPDNVDWKGAEVVMRPAAWIIDRAVVDAQYGDALNLFNYSNYTPRDNSEYFFQNHPATLDKNGEWCYDQANKKVLVYTNQGAPTDGLYTATAYSLGVDIANVSYITLRNLNIAETLNTSINGQNVSNFAMTDLDITNAGEDGIVISGSGNNILLENSKIKTVNNNGVWIGPYQTVNIRGNDMRRIALIAGRGKSGDGQYNGISSMANQNVMIENNVIDSVGYNGVTFWTNTTIRQNVIANFCFSKIDGGGIYSHNAGKSPMTNIHLLSNIIYTNPLPAGGTPWADYTIGIFLDDCVENVEIKNNTVFGNAQWGVFLHGAPNVTFTDNTLYNNRLSQLNVYHNYGICPIRNETVKRNIFVSKNPTQLAAQYESNADDILQYGLIDSNYYASPFNESAMIRGVAFNRGGNFNVNGWNQFSGGHDAHSRSSPLLYNEFKNEGSGGISRINSPFDEWTEGWELVYSPYGNAELAYAPQSPLDGGSMRISFPVLSGQSNSYAQVVKRFGNLSKGKGYVLRFDAVSSVDVPILVYLRQYGFPYQEFDRRYPVTIGATRKSYELPFIGTAFENDPVVMFQTDTEGPVIWIDNVRLQEDVPIINQPDDLIQLYYNPTLKDSTIILPAGAFRDVKNQAYANLVLLKPFTSIILLKDTIPLPPADLSLSLASKKRILQVNEPTEIRLRVRNEGNTQAELARWTYRLPANLQFIDSAGQPYTDNVLNGTVNQLAPQTDTTFSILVKPTLGGLFRTSAQLTTATSHDPDSNPNTGTYDGEDDASTTELRVGASASIFESPNPNQRPLPAVVSNQPVPDPAKADLSLAMSVNQRIPVVGDVLSYTISVSNAGGRTADGVQLQNMLPTGFQLVEATDWTINGLTMTRTLPSLLSGTTTTVSFRVRVLTPGHWVNQAQISASNVGDPDSTPGNGFTNGEDDQTQVDIRAR